MPLSDLAEVENFDPENDAPLLEELVGLKKDEAVIQEKFDKRVRNFEGRLATLRAGRCGNQKSESQAY